MKQNNGELPFLVKIGHTRSSCKLNIPIGLARSIGLDKAKHVIVIKRGSNKLEVKRYESAKDYQEYVQGNFTIVD